MSTSGPDATTILERLQAGDESAAAQLLPVVYDELRALAGHYFKDERTHHTLEPTAVVHEAYLRLIAQRNEPWSGRAHFLAIAARAMRQVLIDHARRRNAQKRGGQDWQRITLDRALEVAQSDTLEIIDFEESLCRLAEVSPRQARVVELRVFGGLTIEEVGEILDLARSTVSDEWAIGKAWLKRECLRDTSR